MRFLVGVDYRWIVPYAALLRGISLVLADLAARMALRPAELPVGVMTALIDGPAFIALAREALAPEVPGSPLASSTRSRSYALMAASPTSPTRPSPSSIRSSCGCRCTQPITGASTSATPGSGRNAGIAMPSRPKRRT